MEKWIVSAKRADFNAWGRRFGISPVAARVIRNRDVTDEEGVEKFLNGTLADCYDPWLLPDMDKAVEEILRFVREGASIRVIGDYDVDGICSSYLLSRGLTVLGGQTDIAIPHRIYDGYGLNEHLIEEAHRDGISLIVTCDNGIAAADQIRLAREYGITVVVTDHHEVPFSLEGGERRELLPPAAAIVDPKRAGCVYPFPGICGCVVAYKLLQALFERTGYEAGKDLLQEFLQFVALATVCDVMELKDENRILVKEGLKCMANTRNLGMKALIEVNGIEKEALTAYHLGFVIGPCMNATGRLDTALRAVELFQCRTWAEAMSTATELKELNDSRKNLTVEGERLAVQYLQEHHMEQDSVQVVYLPQVHESLAGIIAGRIRERYNHPVFILTQGTDGIKGSGRSIDAYHMYEHMTLIKQCFSKFGGHKLAAGMTLAPLYETAEETVEHFRALLNRTAQLTEEDFIPKVRIDVPMPVSYASMEIARNLERLEPYGVGNPRPLFAQKDLCFVRGWLMGAKQNCARYRVLNDRQQETEIVYFGDLDKFHAFLDEKYGAGSAARLYRRNCSFLLSVAYQLTINVYRGEENLELIMKNYC